LDFHCVAVWLDRENLLENPWIVHRVNHAKHLTPSKTFKHLTAPLKFQFSFRTDKSYSMNSNKANSHNEPAKRDDYFWILKIESLEKIKILKVFASIGTWVEFSKQNNGWKVVGEMRMEMALFSRLNSRNLILMMKTKKNPLCLN
jgi:hypothetical protein